MKRAIINQLFKITTAAYTGVSEFTRQSLARYEKIPIRAVEVIYNGIEKNGICKVNGVRSAVRREAGLTDQDLMVLAVGRMDPIKDFKTLIRAFALVARQLPQAWLWIAGGGEATYQQELIRLAAQEGADRIRFLGACRDVDALLEACDLFVLSSITEATSMTILEAMAAGRAVVATRTGGNPEIVIDQETGMLVPVGDVSGMSIAIVQLLKDTEGRKRMGQNGQERIQKHFSKEEAFLKYRDLYRSVNYVRGRGTAVRRVGSIS
jgi:glycosyltransferase involved in cell wall biosynthesis